MNQSRQVQIDAEAQKLLGKLIKHRVYELKPTLKREGVRYLDVEERLQSDVIGVVDVLQTLEKQGVLKSKVVDRVLTCPDCVLGPRIRELREDPELQELMQDPEVVTMAQSGDTLALMGHPGFRRLITRVASTPN